MPSTFGRICTMTIGTALFAAVPARASEITIQDASQIKYAINGNRVYLRNLNMFNSGWPGCCFAAWIDLSTESGRAMFASFLTRSSARQKINIFMSNPGAGGIIEQLGDW